MRKPINTRSKPERQENEEQKEFKKDIETQKWWREKGRREPTKESFKFHTMKTILFRALFSWGPAQTLQVQSNCQTKCMVFHCFPPLSHEVIFDHSIRIFQCHLLPIASMGLVYLHIFTIIYLTWKPIKHQPLHVGKYAIVPWMLCITWIQGPVLRRHADGLMAVARGGHLVLSLGGGEGVVGGGWVWVWASLGGG